MQKKIFILLLGACFLQAQAQINDAFSFQGIIFDNNGNPSSNQRIEVTSNIADNSNGQNIIYTEVHDIITNENGLFDIAIGNGIALLGEFTDVDWLSYVPYVQITYNLNDGAEDVTIPWTKFKSVPFCFSSKYIVCSDGIDGLQGPQGERGPPGINGINGTNGLDGTDGINCWDTNRNRINDPSEDSNSDGLYNSEDCNNGIPVLPLLSTPPTTNIQEGSIYMDNGTNRDDTLPGFRYYDGVAWIDL